MSSLPASDLKAGPSGAARDKSILLWLCIGLLLAWMYGARGNMEEVARVGRSAMAWMIREWNTPGGEYSHGWLVPLVSAMAIWLRRKELAALPRHVTWAGVIVVAGALLLYAAGIKIQQTRLVLVSLVALVWGIALGAWGWAVARRLVFPCGYLLFCVPLVFIDALTFPLRLLASRLAESLLNGMGIAVTRVGTALLSASGAGINIDVADPCSGMHSLMAMAALGAAYAYFTQPSQTGKWLLFLGSLPIAIAGNVTRVISIALVAAWFGQERAMVFYHDFSGYVLFGAAVLLMMGLGTILNRWLTREKGSHA